MSLENTSRTTEEHVSVDNRVEENVDMSGPSTNQEPQVIFQK